MSWLFSRALVEEYSAASCWDGAPSARLSGNPIPQAYCALDKMTAFSRLSRFGMTFAALTENLGEELLTSYLAAFHAKTSAQPEKAQELTENAAECGEKWHGSFTKYSPATSSWKTHQCSLAGDLDEFSETWPQWGLMRGGECWEQQTLVRPINETEFGLSEQTWPTPAARDGNTTNTLETLLDGRFVDQLANRVKMVENNIWTTPCSRDWKGHTITPNHPNGFNKSLANDVLKFPTPQASDFRDRGNMSNPSIQRRAEKGKQLNLSMVAHPTSGQLNPDWVEWLMNWPITWSSLNAVNRKEFQLWQEASAAALQESGQLRTMWWDRDPSQAPSGQRSDEQPEQERGSSMQQMPRSAACRPEVEGSHEGSELPLLRNDLHLQARQGEDVQQGVREQTGLDEAQTVPRVADGVTARVDRLKAIGNGQVPLCAATAWRLLK
jgi:hypothetical protein